MLKWSCFYRVTKSWTELPLFLKIWIPLCIKQWFNILLNVKRGSLAEWAVRPQVQVRTWLLAGFVPSSPELKSLTTLVNEQLVQSCALAEPNVACEYSCFSLFLTAKDVFCFCREGFSFAVRYFVFAVRFLVLPWGILFLPWGFWFCRDVFVSAMRFLVLLWRVSCGPPYGSYHEFTNNNFAFHESQNQFFTFSRFTNNRGHTKCQKRCISPIL